MILFKALKCSLLGSPIIQDLTILGASGALVLDHTALVGLSPGGTGILLRMGAVILPWMGWPLAGLWLASSRWSGPGGLWAAFIIVSWTFSLGPNGTAS